MHDLGEDPHDRVGTVGGPECVAAAAFGKALGEFGKDLQMLLGGLFGNQQHEEKRDRFTVGRVKRDGRGQAQKGAAGLGEALDTAVRNGDTATEPGRTELFTRKKAVEYGAARDPLIIFEENTSVLENSLFTAGVKIKDDVFGG